MRSVANRNDYKELINKTMDLDEKSIHVIKTNIDVLLARQALDEDEKQGESRDGGISE